MIGVGARIGFAEDGAELAPTGHWDSERNWAAARPT